jgi:hypothetical protein
MAYRVFIALFLLIYGMGIAQSQRNIDTAFNRYAKKIPQQKIHLHFDNHLYNPGQTIWYKAYLFSGIEPSPFGKSIYVDWYDDHGKYLSRTVSPISGASANSSFTIPAPYYNGLTNRQERETKTSGQNNIDIFSRRR